MLKLNQVQKEFRGGEVAQRAVQKVSLEVGASEFIILSGRSGSGKTTLLNLIGGLEIPDDGEILFEGRNLAVLTDHELSQVRREKIGFIFQTFNLIPVLSAFENVEYPLIMLGVSAIERRERVTRLLKEVGLQAHHASKPGQLSGGQRQRVAIARALIKRPSLVLADEPTANLDSQTSSEVIGLIQSLFAGTNSSIIFSTHDSEMVRHGTRWIEMSDGKLVQDRTSK